MRTNRRYRAWRRRRLGGFVRCTGRTARPADISRCTAPRMSSIRRYGSSNWLGKWSGIHTQRSGHWLRLGMLLRHCGALWMGLRRGEWRRRFSAETTAAVLLEPLDVLSVALFNFG